ncbi:MAG: M15 family metallopeptidase [Lachnospiraceae bacterium]|nr:M15 family metallopeptidase [Lachnospiraceae bacterium]
MIFTLTACSGGGNDKTGEAGREAAAEDRTGTAGTEDKSDKPDDSAGAEAVEPTGQSEGGSTADTGDAGESEGETEKGLPDYRDSKISGIDDDFYICSISDKLFDRMYGLSFKEDCTVPREELRYLHVLHKDLDGETHEGEMVVNRAIADDVLDILKKLYDADYPIERMVLVDDYGADDETSMRANNSSSFNFRFISHTTVVSKHGRGLAVDINTLYNPYIKTLDDGTDILEPATAGDYVDRTKDFPYKIDENDLCYKLFTEKGFEWGGNWVTCKDYQHFEMPDSFIEALDAGND